MFFEIRENAVGSRFFSRDIIIFYSIAQKESSEENFADDLV